MQQREHTGNLAKQSAGRAASDPFIYSLRQFTRLIDVCTAHKSVTFEAGVSFEFRMIIIIIVVVSIVKGIVITIILPATVLLDVMMMMSTAEIVFGTRTR